MQSLFRRSTSLPQVAALDWRVGALALTAALILSQGCGIIADAPNRVVSTRGVSPWESQTDNPPSDKPPTNTFPRPPIPKVPSPPESEQAPPIAKIPAPSQPTMMETGLASWYGPKFHGKLTASGEVFNQEKFTAAHPTLPWGSKVKVTNLDNGKSVDVRINDRGPFGKGRIIDVSRAAARALGMVGRGITTVQLEWLSDSEKTNELVLQDK
jgi:rare lipoprotein A (peptidoglycan hydrolase)